MVTQYHPDTGASYPLSTYALLIFQTFLSASASVYNQSLCKRGTASLHGDNQTLYASGAAINLVIHIIMTILKPDEPSFFTGYNSIGAIMVVLSNVFIGLAITAVYKYADAIIKCFATAVSTGILLYLSPILFGAEMSFIVLPGTLVVFISTWLYMEAAPPKSSPNLTPEQAPPTMLSQVSERVSAKVFSIEYPNLTCDAYFAVTALGSQDHDERLHILHDRRHSLALTRQRSHA